MCLKTCLSDSSRHTVQCYKNSVSPTCGNIFSFKLYTEVDNGITSHTQSQKMYIEAMFRKQMETILSANSNFSSVLTHGLFSLLKGLHDDNLCMHSPDFNRILDSSLAFIIIMNDIDFGAVHFNFDKYNIEKSGRRRNTRLTNLFDLCCELRWPFNLIISENSLLWMRNVFKFLLALRWAVVCMEECWHYLRDRAVPASIQKRHQLLLCQREMKHYISQLEYYVLHQIVDVCWSTFDRDLKLCKTLDNIYNAHNRYINDIVTRCLLTPKAEPIFRSIHKLLDCAICFRRSLIDNRSEECALADYIVAKLADRVLFVCCTVYCL
uniref:Gamma-tubulin complex component n=1 Tax=Romanomermis culicivorax TaxID=13658 RepID=A0A915IV30_ROMCU